jgi:hypothetical protein
MAKLVASVVALVGPERVAVTALPADSAAEKVRCLYVAWYAQARLTISR